MYQRRTVASGGKRGSADPTCQPFKLRFGGKLDPILLKAVDEFPYKGIAGTDLKHYIKGLPPLSLTHTTWKPLYLHSFVTCTP